jgi:hypothetical protein
MRLGIILLELMDIKILILAYQLHLIEKKVTPYSANISKNDGTAEYHPPIFKIV